MHAYQDPLADFFPIEHGHTPAVFRPLPVLSIVPAVVLDDDEDPSPIDPRSWDDIPVQAEPDDFRAEHLLALELAANEDWPAPESYPAYDHADVEPSAAVTATPVQKRVKGPKPRRSAAPTKEVKAGSHPKYAFRFALMADPMLKPASKVVGIYLADLIDEDTGKAYPNREQVMAATGMTIDGVKRAFRDLRGSWFRSFQRNGWDRNQWVPLYKHPEGERWVLKEIRQGERTVMQWYPAGIDDDGSDEGEHGCTPLGGKDAPLRGARMHPRGGTDAPQTHRQHTANTTEETHAENEAAAASASSSPIRSHLSFDDGWPVFKEAWPVLVDDQWRPAFIAARRDGWSLQQILAGILHVQAALPDGAVMVNVGRFLAQQMWMTSPDDQPEHHDHENEPSKSSWQDDDDTEVPF